MSVGYARVSTQEQTPHIQQDALKKAGCKRISTDTIHGASQERKGLQEALTFMREGDMLVRWKLDRLGRSLKHLVETVNALSARGVGFKSLTEQIYTTTPGGNLIFHVFEALAEFKRDLIRDRSNSGLAAARARGRKGGRPQKLDEKRVQVLRRLYAGKSNSVQEIPKAMSISPSTLCRYVKPDADL